jgi:RNA polymerase sigma-70 factor, ECF subfamily
MGDAMDETLAAALIQSIEAEYPELRVSPDVLARAIADRSLAPDTKIADLYLAEACACADEHALRIFDATFGSELDVAIAKSPRLGVSQDEFRQIFRERFLVARPDGRARIATYHGHGPLKAWVRVAAARLVIDLSRRPKEPEPYSDADLMRHLPATADPEIEYLRRAYAEQLPEAFSQALSRLSVRQRNLLRQRHLHGLGGVQLATLYGVHRATVFGWLDAARKALMDHLREAIRVRVPAHDLESIVNLLGSRLEMSVRRMLDSRLEDE